MNWALFELDDIDKAGDMQCMFCGEKEFDRVGLKHHLNNYCTAFSETISAEEESQMLQLTTAKGAGK